jgi:hypothetical protein
MNYFTKILSSLSLPVYLILSSFIILFPAIFNGYPLFYSDSAVYIYASNLFGMLSRTTDFPYLSGMGYALFIRIVTWRYSLYLVVLAQGLILNILIYYTLTVLIPERKTYTFHLPIIIILSLCSSMGWTASQLMPDIFTSFMVLSVFLFYSWNKKSWGIYIFLSIIIIFSILSHLSNISIVIFMLGLLFLLFIIKSSFRRNLKLFLGKTAIVIALVMSSLFVLIGINNKYYNYKGISPTSHIFFIARLMEIGFMPEYLNKNCAEKQYEICKYKDNLPTTYDNFLWSSESVFYKTGGWDLKKYDHKEYKSIIFDVLTTPKYLGKFLYSCALNTSHQLSTFEIGEGLNNSYNKKSPQYRNVILFFDHREFREDFLNSKQIQGTLYFDRVNIINYILFAISTLIILWTLFRKKLDRNMFLFTFLVISSVIINAASTSSLSSIYNRFQSRIIWLIPLLACIYFSVYIYPAIKNNIISSRKSKIQL